MTSNSKRPKSAISNTLSRRAFATGCLAGSALLHSASRNGPALFAAALRPTQKAKSPMVSTMNGLVSCDSLGTTLMHEHLIFFSGPRLDNLGYTPIPDDMRSDTVDFVVSLLNDASRVGIDTVVDLTPYRPIDLYEQIAKRTSVKIVPSTGFYRREKIPKRLADMDDEERMKEYMLKEVTEGIEDTRIRAGIIKIAQERTPLSDWEKKVFRAAARVQKATGVPIATHCGSASEQFDLLAQAGANPRRIFFSHVDVGRKGQPGDQLLSIVKEGSSLEVDTFGQEFYTPWAELTSFLRSLCEAGYANRVIISIDCNWHWADGKKVFEGAEAPYFDPNASKRTYAYMMTDAVPALLKSGFSKKEIDTFLVENPRRFFCGM
jgi:phosphotriesterase-related protein